MPLTYDNEYQQELDKISKRALRTSRAELSLAVLFYAVVYMGVAFIVVKSGISDTLAYVLTAGVSVACLGITVVFTQSKIMNLLEILVGATEWIGRKQLGEYIKPRD